MKRLLAILLLVALYPAVGYGQAVQQGGSWTAGQVPTYSSSGVSSPIVQQSGPAAGTGVGVGELSIIARGRGTAPHAGQGTGQNGTIFQIQDAPSNNAAGYHALSLSANAMGGGLLSYNAYGGATALPLSFYINGSTYQFPFNGGTNVPYAAAGGTANAITATLSLDSLAAGNSIVISAAAANTTINPTLTLTLNNAVTVGPFTIKKFGGQALLPHDIFAATHRLYLVYTGSGFELLNPTFSTGDNVINMDNLGVGSSDDTAIWQLVDTQIGLNSQLPKKVWLSKQTNVKNLQITNIQAIEGIKDQTGFALTADGGPSDIVLWYIGAGPFDISNVAFSCSIYDPATPLVAPNGLYALRIAPVTQDVQSTHITARHIRTTGCQFGIVIFQADYVTMEDIFNDRPYQFGWIISDARDSLTAHTRHIRVKDTYGVSPGAYCGSMPVNETAGTLAPVHINVSNVGCEGAGWIFQKDCFDFTGTAFAYGTFEGWGRNCFNGGMEVKRTNATNPNIPDYISGIDIKFDYWSNIDQGIGFSWANGYDSGAVTADRHRRHKSRVLTVFDLPPAWQTSTYYDGGSVFTSSGNTYIVRTPGTSSSGAGPSGTGNGLTDGTAKVDYIQATPSNAAFISGGSIDAFTDVDAEFTFYGVANGVVLATRGGVAGEVTRVNLKMIGWATLTCLSDSAFWTGTVDRLVVEGSCRTFTASNNAVFDLGNSANTYTNFELKGGPWEGVSSTAGAGTGAYLMRLHGGSLTGTIAGGVHLKADSALFYNQAALNLKIGGGGVWTQTSTGTTGLNAIYATGVGATGTIEAGQIQLTSSLTNTNAVYDAWVNNSSATMNIYGRFIRGFLSSTPTGTIHCNSGDTYWAQAPGVGGQPAQGWYCSTPGTTWTSF